MKKYVSVPVCARVCVCAFQGALEKAVAGRGQSKVYLHRNESDRGARKQKAKGKKNQLRRNTVGSKKGRTT